MWTRTPAALFILLATSLVAQNTADSTVHIRNIVLTGKPGLTIQEQHELAAQLKKLEYTGNYAVEIAERIRFALQDHGYFKAIARDPQITTVQSLPQRKLIDVVVPVDSGAMYYLEGITFKGETIFPETELRAEFHLSTGNVFSRTEIGKGLDNLRRLYCQKGYGDFTAVPDVVLNETKHTVSLLISVDEGEPYRYGKLTVSGDESVMGAKQRLLKAWTPYEGKAYDCSDNPPKAYFHDLHLRPSLQPDKFVETSFDNKSHLVNLQIRLARPPFPAESSPTQH